MDKSPEAFRTISEVAEALEIPAHVLRFWESRFPQIRPIKRAGGRRYYRPADITLLANIKRLLHDEGLTIRGVQKILREQGAKHLAPKSLDGVCEAAPIDGPEMGLEPPIDRILQIEADDDPSSQSAYPSAQADLAEDVADPSHPPAPLISTLQDLIVDELEAFAQASLTALDLASFPLEEADPEETPPNSPFAPSQPEGAALFAPDDQDHGPIAPYIEVDSVTIAQTSSLATQIRALCDQDLAKDPALLADLAALQALLMDLRERLVAARG